MTENRCIEVLKKMKHMFTETCAKIDENTALDMAVEAIMENKQYRAIGTVEQLKTMFDGFWKLKDLCEEYEKYGLPEDYWKLNETCKEYSAIGTIDEFKVLKEKNEPKELAEHNFQDEVHHYLCPSCRSIVSCTQNYCEECGQALET